MATIPIEVIVQDAESPVTPTPVDPTDQGENTNIIVPDTGAGTVDNNSGVSGPSAAISIVSIVIVVLAIGAVITLLVRKYNKRKKASTEEAGMTRQEKRAMAATSTIAVLALTVLLGQLVVAGVVNPIATNAAADNEINHIDVVDKISIVVERTEDSEETVAKVTNVSYITSTADFGYKVTVAMAADATTANLYLDGDETSEYYIAPVVDDALSGNTWGYTLAEEEPYLPVPLADNAAIVLQGDTKAEDKEMTIYYGVNVNKELPTGTYKGEAEYNLIPMKPIDRLTYMQDFNTLSAEDKVAIINSMVEDEQYYLKDSRDNKEYRIAKLKDGNVWMIQNIDLQEEDLLTGVTLNDVNTDNPADGFALPASQISNGSRWIDLDNQATSINTSHVYDTAANGEVYKYCLNYQGVCLEYGDDIPGKELGNLYNWYTATAGTGTYSIEDGDVATGSICPAGWRLPTGSSDNEMTDYSNLLYLYGILESPISRSYNSDKLLSMLEVPLSLVPAGKYTSPGGAPSGWVSNVGEYGYIWSSASSDYSTRARNLAFSVAHVNPWNGNGNYNNEKYEGNSVRCIVR